MSKAFIWSCSYYFWCSSFLCLYPDFHLVSFSFWLKDFLHLLQCRSASNEFFQLSYNWTVFISALLLKYIFVGYRMLILFICPLFIWSNFAKSLSTLLAFSKPTFGSIDLLYCMFSSLLNSNLIFCKSFNKQKPQLKRVRRPEGGTLMSCGESRAQQEEWTLLFPGKDSANEKAWTLSLSTSFSSL